MSEAIAFDHIHLLSRDPRAAANWYREMFGGEISTVQESLRGAPQIALRVGRSIDRYHMAKHFELTITDSSLTWVRNSEKVKRWGL